MIPENPADSTGDRVCLGVVAGAHGVRGLVRLRSFAENPSDIAAYGPLESADGQRRFDLTLTGNTARYLIGRIRGIEDRDAALALTGQTLHVSRALLPRLEEQDVFYRHDLIGLAVEQADGKRWGRVKTVENYGAGDILVIAAGAEETEVLLPFDRETVPDIDPVAGRLVAEPPVDAEETQ